MGPTDEAGRAGEAADAWRPGAAAAVAGLAVWLLRISAALVLAVPLLLAALLLAG